MNVRDKLFSFREQILYLIFGVLATIISVVSFALCVKIWCIDPLLSNILSWVAAVVFAYFTNRFYVFQVQKGNAIKQFCKFISGRLFTLLLEETVFLLLMRSFSEEMIIKAICQSIVIVTNYLISKLIVFRKPHGTD